MSYLKCYKDFAVVGCGKSISVYSLCEGNRLFSYDHEFNASIKDGKNNDIICRIEDLQISNLGEYLCALFSDKTCICWKTIDYTQAIKIEVKRRSTAVCFDSNDESVLIADKSGDVYRYFLSECVGADEKCLHNEPILGHVSMLLDIKVTCNGRFLLTADRDEKVRVSLLDKPYVIQSFCLGHTEFVCALMPLVSNCDNRQYFFSASGDGTIIMWEPDSGKQCGRFRFSSDVTENGQTRFIPSLMAISQEKFAVASLQDNKVFMFSVSLPHASFNHIYTITISDCTFVSGISILANQLLVLCINSDDRLFLKSYSLKNTTFDLSSPEAIDVINEDLSKVPVIAQESKYGGLFRTRCDGVVYEAYVKKKQERLKSMQSLNVEKQESDAKKIKLDANTQKSV